MRNGAVQNVFGIRLGLLAGVVGGACDHRWWEKARRLFENIEESTKITIRGGSWTSKILVLLLLACSVVSIGEKLRVASI